MRCVDPLKSENVAVEGLPFIREEKVYRRLREKPDTPLPKQVESLLWNTAGGQLRFALRGRTLGVRVCLRAEAGRMYHMPATGEAGIDCYVSFSGSEPEFLAVAQPEPGKREYESVFFTLPEEKLTDVTLNLPLYNGIEKLELLVGDTDEILPPLRGRKPGRIVVYGGSIDQGGCAARPGMAYTNILSRWMNQEFVNLGFSGAGKAEEEVAAEIVKIPGVTAFVVNTAGNCPDADWLRSHMPRFLEVLREAYPETPILIYQLAEWTRERVCPEEWKVFQEKWAVEEQVTAARKAAGDAHISIYKMDYTCSFMGHDLSREVAVDGIHPTDLGFVLHAERLYPILKELP